MPVYKEDFRKLCKIYVTSCPDPIIESVVNEVIRDFCTKTHSYRTQVSLDITGSGDGNTLNTHPSFEATDWVSYMDKSANAAIARKSLYARTGTYSFGLSTLLDTANIYSWYIDPTNSIYLDVGSTYELIGYMRGTSGGGGTVRFSVGYGSEEHFTEWVVPNTNFQELSTQFVAENQGLTYGWVFWYYWNNSTIGAAHLYIDDVTLQKVIFPRNYEISDTLIPMVIKNILQEGKTDYLVETSEEELNHAWPNWRNEESDTPTHYYLDSNANLVLYPKPNTLMTMDIDLVVKPKKTATEYIDILYEDYGEIIQSGILSKLFAMADKPWTNPTQFAFWEMKYRDGIGNTRRRLIKSRGNKGSYAKPQPYGGVTTFKNAYRDTYWDV